MRVLPPGASFPATRGKAPNAAFDLWLDRSLKELCESVASEQIPEELLRLIEADQAKAGGQEPGPANAAEPEAQQAEAQQAGAKQAEAKQAGKPPSDGS